MTGGEWDGGRVDREVALLSEDGLASYELRVAAMERLGGAMTLDGWCFSTADPSRWR